MAHTNVFEAGRSYNRQRLPTDIEAPRVGLEPTTNGLTVPPKSSPLTHWVLPSAVLSDVAKRSYRPVLPCGAWCGYTNGYT